MAVEPTKYKERVRKAHALLVQGYIDDVPDAKKKEILEETLAAIPPNDVAVCFDYFFAGKVSYMFHSRLHSIVKEYAKSYADARAVKFADLLDD